MNEANHIDIAAPQNLIAQAEEQLGILLPEGLKRIWCISNGLEYPQDWRIYPVFNPKNTRKSWGHIVEENTRRQDEYIQENLLKIAGDSYGNHLVLVVQDGKAGEQIYHWNHETSKLRKSPITFEKILAKAKRRYEKIEKQIQRNMRKKRKRSSK
jgi:cell wall assembly regulator SMI1